ncbi:MAG: alcohol dehydrogenase catalytic domain-containing protein [Armatimonadetes bacterium]|nr:alcohol dehydrogenase catalytic domain-containing protein [Armatimonadota bacterium]
MRAAVYTGPEQLAVLDVATPACPAGGALLAVEACAVCGTDARIYRSGNRGITPPRIIGHEVVGRIIATDTAAAAVGQRVTVAPAVGCGACRQCAAGRPNRCADLRTIGYQWDGAFAEVLAIPAEAVRQGSLCPVPDALPAEQACLAEPLACCLNGQELVASGPGDRVVIAGAGPIGSLHARLAWSRGASQVILIETSAERRAQAERLGLGTVVADDSGVRDLTEGGADVAIVAASVPALYGAAPRWLAKGGRLSLFAGLPPSETLTPLPANQIHYDEITVVGAHGSSPAHNRTALALIVDGRLSVADLVTSIFPLEACVEAIRTTLAGQGVKNVVSLA